MSGAEAVFGTAEFEELQAFRRQAEVEKLRAEVKASMASTPSSKSGGCAAKGDALTPKTKRLVLAQTRVLCKSGDVQALVENDCQCWEDVEERLASQPAPVVKQLLQQLSPHSNIPRLKQDVVKLVWLSCKSVMTTEYRRRTCRWAVAMRCLDCF